MQTLRESGMTGQMLDKVKVPVYITYINYRSKQMKKLIVAAALAVSFAAPAAATEFMVHGLSYHTKNNERYNNVNPGVTARLDNGVVIGSYKNSFKETTRLAGYEYVGAYNLGAFAALATGYKQSTGHAVSLIGGLTGKVMVTEAVGVKVLFVPPIKGAAGVVHAGLLVKF